MGYRSRKQDRDQKLERRIADSYKGHNRTNPRHKPDTKALEIMEQNVGMTYSEALDELIKAELVERLCCGRA